MLSGSMVNIQYISYPLYKGREKPSFNISQPFSINFKGGENLGVWRDVLGEKLGN